MSQAHHPDAVEENIETHPVKLAIWIGIGTVSLIVGIILLAQFAIGAYGSRSLEGSPAMAPEVLAKRIGPVAKLQVMTLWVHLSPVTTKSVPIWIACAASSISH